MWNFIVIATILCQFNTEGLILPVPTKITRLPSDQFDTEESLKCEGNMVKYISDNNETVCDCFFGQLRYLEDNQCYLPYSQGPCPAGQHLVYNESEHKVECVTNPCEIEDYVPYNGTCYKLHKFGEPCEEHEILAIDQVTFKVQCDVLTVQHALVTAPLKECAPGSERGVSGICMTAITDK